MKAISLTQPWATLVVIGAKRYETRSWRTPYRGRLAIHAAKRFPSSARALCAEPPFREALAGLVIDHLPRGELVGLVTLLDCYPTTEPLDLDDRERAFGDYSSGRWAWELADPFTLPEPIPMRGALGLWNTDVGRLL